MVCSEEKRQIVKVKCEQRRAADVQAVLCVHQTVVVLVGRLDETLQTERSELSSAARDCSDTWVDLHGKNGKNIDVIAENAVIQRILQI